MLPLSSL